MKLIFLGIVVITILIVPSRAGMVSRASACWLHAGSGGMIGPGFEPHQCLLAGMWKRMAQLPCLLLRAQQVLHQRWISRECVTVCLCQACIRLSTLVLKPRGDITRSPKQGYQWPHKKDLCPPNFFLIFKNILIVPFQNKGKQKF